MNTFAILASIAHCYVGCNTGSDDLQALHVLECDTETGAAKIVQSVKGVQGTTYFTLDDEGEFLYTAIGEDVGGRKAGSIVKFPIENGWRLGEMERLCRLPCETPCHIALDKDGKRALFAAYVSATAGSVGTDGTDLKTFVFPDDAMGPNKKRQKKAYAHQAFTLPDGTAGIVDLGCDRVWFFDPATMKRVESRTIKSDPGDGPRHCIVSKDGKFLFVLNELSSTVSSYSVPDFRRVGKWSMLPVNYTARGADGASPGTKAAAIKLTADGRILMASNRGFDSIAFYAVGDDGSLALKNIAKLNGSFPRDFALMPGERFMVVGHKMSNEVQVYKFDRDACTLEPAGEPIPVWRPLCFAMKCD